MSPTQHLWVDCDPGHDDAMALMLAGHTPGLELLGVSTVCGNQTTHKVTQNALAILDAAGLSHIAVVPGQEKPIMRPAPLCPEIHGDSGLDGPKGKGALLPPSGRAAHPGKAVLAMWNAISTKHQELGGKQKIRLCCCGALTNAAVLFTLFPEVVGMVDLVLMGGAMGMGNTGPVAEFNIQTDPEAAKIVFESGVDLTMMPLEVTHTVLVTPDVLRKLNVGPEATPFLQRIEQMLLFFKDTYAEVFGFVDPPLHDPTTVAWVAAPHIFQTKVLRVDIETASPLSFGQTVCDVWRQTGREPNCRVATAVDLPAFWELMANALACANAVSPLNNPSN